MMWKIPVALMVSVGIVGSIIFGNCQPLLQRQEDTTFVSTPPVQPEYQPLPIVLNEWLTIESLGGYEGPYLEDGSYDEVSDVLAVNVRNNGKLPIKNTEFTLKTASEEYHFQGSFIGPGQTCVLLELGRALYRGEFDAVGAGVVTPDHRNNLLNTQIIIDEGSNDVLTVTNNTFETIGESTLFYKTYFSQTDTLMGGVTYQMKLQKLEPGQSQSFPLPYYVTGYSKVVAIYSD